MNLFLGKRECRHCIRFRLRKKNGCRFNFEKWWSFSNQQPHLASALWSQIQSSPIFDTPNETHMQIIINSYHFFFLKKGNLTKWCILRRLEFDICREKIRYLRQTSSGTFWGRMDETKRKKKWFSLPSRTDHTPLSVDFGMGAIELHWKYFTIPINFLVILQSTLVEY